MSSHLPTGRSRRTRSTRAARPVGSTGQIAIDTMTINVFCVDGRRPTLTVLIDAYSRAIIGSRLDFSPEAEPTAG